MREEVETRELVELLEDAANEPDLDATGLAHNLYEATLEQLHEIVEFAERLRQGALIEMWLRERKALGQHPTTLEDPPEGYAGYRPQD